MNGNDLCKFLKGFLDVDTIIEESTGYNLYNKDGEYIRTYLPLDEYRVCGKYNNKPILYSVTHDCFLNMCKSLMYIDDNMWYNIGPRESGDDLSIEDYYALKDNTILTKHCITNIKNFNATNGFIPTLKPGFIKCGIKANCGSDIYYSQEDNKLLYIDWYSFHMRDIPKDLDIKEVLKDKEYILELFENDDYLPF